jgi:enoyl-CoA hydratase
MGAQRSAEFIAVSKPAPKITKILLNRPKQRNAQSYQLLYELNDAFSDAAHDDGTSVIILAAEGPDFSAGHDLKDTQQLDTLRDRSPVGVWGGYESAGAEGRMAMEKEVYIGFCERWRSIPKPTIAQVHGRVIAGGLMLVWPCDIIVASDDAKFQDNTGAMGVCGVEFFNHPWELGVRKAKEMLFTADYISAADAKALGMVNHVVARADLERFTLDLATRIAAKPSFALRMIKEAVNGAQDVQGRVAAQNASFALHQLCHAHNISLHGALVDMNGVAETVRKNNPRFAGVSNT